MRTADFQGVGGVAVLAHQLHHVGQSRFELLVERVWGVDDKHAAGGQAWALGFSVAAQGVASAGDALGSDGKPKRPGLAASGMFVINPPYTLNEQLKAALPDMVELMGQDGHATHTLEIGGTH